MSDTDTETDALITFDIEDDGNVVELRVDRERRTISGLILPWNKVSGPVSYARWRFQRGSVRWARDVSRIKLLRDHDISQPVGRALSLEDREEGIWGTFKIRSDAVGDEVLDLADDKILDGFSGGLVITPNGWELDPADRGVRLVSDAMLRETTVTAMPAFDDARVTRVAASLRLNEEGEMADDKNKGEGQDQGQGGTTVLENQDSGLERFQEEIDKRFTAMADRIAKAQESQQEALAKVVTDAFESAFKHLEDSKAGARAEAAAIRFKVTREEPVYRFDGESRGNSMVRDFWRAQTERDHDAIERLRKFQEQQRDLVSLLGKMPPYARAQFAVTTGNAGDVIPPGYRPDLFVNELRKGRPLVALASRGTITDATPFTVPRFVSSTGATADHVEGVNSTPGSLTLDSVTVSPGATSGRFELTREIVDAANPAIDAIALAAMRESYNQQTEVKAYAELNGTALTANKRDVSLALLDTDLELETDQTIGASRDLLARYPFARFASPTGAAISQVVTRNFANAKGTDGRPLLPSIGAQNTAGLGNAVDQGWFVDGLPFVPAWAITETVGDDIGVILNRGDYWCWESPLLTFRFEEKSGPAIIELALFSYFATHVLRPAGIFALRAIT